MPQQTSESIRQDIIDIVGALRAESLGDQIFDYFAEPVFFPKLQSRQSCVLRGGRGTGKTTLLRCLSYQGQHILRQGDSTSPAEWPFFGVFWRINTNRVAAFDGPELPTQRWVKLFGHYLNLELVDLLLELLVWLRTHGIHVEMPGATYRELATRLNMEAAETLDEARANLRMARAVFEGRLNNIADSDAGLGLSLLGGPLDHFVEALRSTPVFKEKKLFFLIDEYENLLDYQQEVFNTLVKHSSSAYAFKIGVKEMGLRRHTTINPNEQLSSPADYDIITIADELAPRFDGFAERLVHRRLSRVASKYGRELPAIRSMFEALTHDEEAVRLGVGEANREFGNHLLGEAEGATVAARYAELTPLQQFFVAVWAKQKTVCPDVIIDALTQKEATWLRRYGNHSYALLFAIRAGKPGRRKLYSGWATICRLASTNVRYLLELVAGMLERHVQDTGTLENVVGADLQTDVAYDVGRKNLQELERDTDQAASLLRLVLALGRVFEVLAANPVGHTSEVTQFALPSSADVGVGPGDIERRIRDIIDEAVNALAIVRYPASKLQSQSDLRSFDYALHPIFAPLFGYSHRRKRKIVVTEEEFLGLVAEPHWAITRILMRQNRHPSETPIPDQLRLFAGFYA